MMSEGGTEAVEYLFEGITLGGQHLLDIGSGLGGVASYLPQNYDVTVIGLDVNAWIVAEAGKRIPQHLKDRVSFLQSSSNSSWPVANHSCDIIYSKGVLTHVEHKNDIFQECRRILKDDGLLVISDALSSDFRRWGEHIERLNELEKLDMYPESQSGYIELLTDNGFAVQSVRDDRSICIKWTQDIINRLKDPSQISGHVQCFDEHELQAAIIGYESIAKALEVGELRCIRFVATKQ